MVLAQRFLHGAINLEGQSTSVKKAKVEFDAYFQDEGENVRQKEIDVEGEETLYLKLKVEEGYLASGEIKIENANFTVVERKIDTSIIQSISSSENKIVLNKIDKDESVVLEIPVKMNTDSNFSVSDLRKIANIKLQGTYITDKGKEVKLDKEINLEAILEGTAESSLSEEVTKYVTFDVNGQKGVILQTIVKSNLIGNKLPVQSTELEIEIPNINNSKPKTISLSSKSLMATKGTRS